MQNEIFCANIQTVARDATKLKGGENMKLDLLKGKIVANGMNVEKLAKDIGINRASLYRKLNNADKITVGEAIKMKEALKMTDAEASEIFLS